MGLVLLILGMIGFLTLLVMRNVLGEMEMKHVCLITAVLLVIGAVIGSSPAVCHWGRQLWTWLGVAESLYR